MTSQSPNLTGNAIDWKVPPVALEQMTAQHHWMLWKFEQRGGKTTKIPYQASGPTAKANDQSTWCDFDSAALVAHRYSGIGFALLNSGIAAFDIDDCRDAATGDVHPWAQALVEAAGSYAEVTPSGTGLRILGFGSGPKVHRKLKVPDSGVSCELYRQAERYITVTFDIYHDKPLVNIDEHIDRVLRELDKPKDRERAARPDATERPKRRLPLALKSMLAINGDKPKGYASRSDLLWAFLGEALRQGYDEHDIINACLDPAYQGCSIFEHVADNNGEDYLRTQIEKSINDPGTTDEARKQIIRVQSGNLHNDWRATERAMIKAGCPVYVRGEALVQPLWRWERSSIENDRGTLIATFSKLSLARLRDIVGHHAAAFQKFDTKQNRWKPIDPPTPVIETLLDIGHWGFPSVVGIVNSPTMRPDGSLLTEPGYDVITQLWYKPAGDIQLPAVPDRPTKAQADEALQLFKELLSGFPFAGEADEATAIAGALTCVLRGAFDIAPLFFINAPEAGTGKSFLVNVISTIATGRDAAALFSTPNAEEMDKRLSAAAIEARPILNLNNLTDNLESGLLCQMITESPISIRPFGKNTETISCDCRGMTIFANGNGIRIVGDLVRRTVTCRIDAKMESPEERTFAFDPIELVKANRGKYLAAAFTIARAYLAADTPKVDAVHVAGFEKWARFVQRPLVWLGAGDPFSSKNDAKAMDPERAALAERIRCLVLVFGTNRDFDAAAVRTKAEELTMDGGSYPKPKYPQLVEAYGNNRGVLSVKSIGRLITKDIDRVIGDYCLRLSKPNPKTANTYRVEGPETPADAQRDEPF